MKERAEVPDLYIEKLVLGELPEHRREQLLKDPEVRRRVAELEASNREILDAYPAAAMAQAIRRRARALREAQSAEVGDPAESGSAAGEKGRSASGRAGLFGRLSRLRWRGRHSARWRGRHAPRWVPVLGFATLIVAAGLVLATRLPSVRRPSESPSQEVRLKGAGPHLVMYRSTPSGSETLRDRDTVREGDTMQMGYVAAGAEYGVLFSIDGRGTLTVHLPESAGAVSRLASTPRSAKARTPRSAMASTPPLPKTARYAHAMEREGEVRLPFAYRLDDAPDFERFFFVTSAQPFAIDPVLALARELAVRPESVKSGELALPEGLDQTSILLLKHE